MAYSIQTAVSNGTLEVLDLSIKYMDKSHIFVYVDDVLVDGSAYSYVWLTDTRIQVVPAVANGSTLKVIRKTLTDEMWHEFSKGARFSTTSMDENFEQLLFLAQEYSEGIYVTDFYSDLDLHLKRILNLGDPINDGDAVNLKTLKEYLPNADLLPAITTRIAAEEAKSAQLAAQGIAVGDKVIVGFNATGLPDKAWLHFAGRDTIDDGGGGWLRFLAGSTATVNNVTVYAATGGRLVREGWSVFGINVKWAGAKGDGNQTTGIGTNDSPAFNLAIAALGGTHDLGSAYTYVPATPLIVPAGVYILNSGLVANRNNIIIDGAGTFNTVLMCSRNVQISYLMRFQGAYACQLNHLTLDGGLPFTPTGTETYGADVGLVFDQVAHFRSVGLNICNTRYEGKRCIHLWESYFEDLRIFNTGFFGNGANRSAGIRFTQVGKLDNTFVGGESNNIVYNKVAFGTVGSYVSADEVPTYNIFFNDVIAEGRTWTTNYPSLGEIKWRVGGTATNFVVNTGYSFPHAQPFPCNATLFDFSNVGPGCKVRNYRVYQSLDSTYQEITRILSCDSNYTLEFDISVEEVGSNGTVLINSSTISNVTGTWEYRSNLARTRASLFSGTSESRFSGKLLLRDSAATTPYQYRGKSVFNGVIDGDTAVRPQYAAYAFANVDGRSTGGARTLRGLTYTRTSTGQYQFTFTQAMPDAAYAVMVSADVLNDASERPEVGAQTNAGFTIVNRAGFTHYDPSNINVVVFR